jgi:hypothetical protein
MSVRIKRFSFENGGDTNQTPADWTQEQRETTVDGQTFHWAPGQIRNFMDDGVGLNHAAQLGGVSIVRQYGQPLGDSRS